LNKDSRKSFNFNGAEMNANQTHPLRVLYLTDLRPAGKFGSLEEQIFVLAKSLSTLGGTLIPVFGAPIDSATANQYKQIGIVPAAIDLHKFTVPSLSQLLKLVRSNQIEVIHWNFYNPLNPYVWVLSGLAPKVQHYITDHNSRLPNQTISIGFLKSAVKRALLKRYSRVFCISDFVQSKLAEQQVWPQLSRCSYFINVDRFQPDQSVRDQLRAKLGLADAGRFVMLFVGQLIQWKGVDVAIRAMLHLPQSAILLVVGDGQMKTELIELTKDLKLDGRVRFLGPQRNVEPFMQAADCFVCPSVWEEAVGLVNIEALASGLPVVASRIGGIPEFIDDHVTGLLFKHGDDRELADRVNYLIENPDVLKTMSQKARIHAAEKFSIEMRVPDYLEFYSNK